MADRVRPRNRVLASLLVGMVAAVIVGSMATSAFGAGYQLNGLGASCTEPGNSNTVHGNKFTSGSNVSIILGTVTIGVVAADAQGNVAATFTVPSATPSGATTVKLVGPSTDGTRTLSFDLQVGDCTPSNVSGNNAGTEGGTGALAFTGGSTGLTFGVGAAVLIVGIALLVAAKRRKGESVN